MISLAISSVLFLNQRLAPLPAVVAVYDQVDAAEFRSALPKSLSEEEIKRLDPNHFRVKELKPGRYIVAFIGEKSKGKREFPRRMHSALAYLTKLPKSAQLATLPAEHQQTIQDLSEMLLGQHLEAGSQVGATVTRNTRYSVRDQSYTSEAVVAGKVPSAKDFSGLDGSRVSQERQIELASRFRPSLEVSPNDEVTVRPLQQSVTWSATSKVMLTGAVSFFHEMWKGEQAKMFEDWRKIDTSNLKDRERETLTQKSNSESLNALAGKVKSDLMKGKPTDAEIAEAKKTGKIDFSINFHVLFRSEGKQQWFHFTPFGYQKGG